MCVDELFEKLWHKIRDRDSIRKVDLLFFRIYPDCCEELVTYCLYRTRLHFEIKMTSDELETLYLEIAEDLRRWCRNYLDRFSQNNSRIQDYLDQLLRKEIGEKLLISAKLRAIWRYSEGMNDLDYRNMIQQTLREHLEELGI